jgi:soluble lytic murein transglycosylase-like protein
MLWRLKDATLGADNAPGWKTLFVQALGSHLMAYSSYTPLERGEAARLEAFVDDHRSSVLGFFARMGQAKPSAALRDAVRGEAPAPDRAAAVAAANAVTPAERQWLAAHVEADGACDPLEQALLAFLAEENGS